MDDGAGDAVQGRRDRRGGFQIPGELANRERNERPGAGWHDRESPTLSHDEHKRVVEITIAEARGRVPVIAADGSNNTAEAIDLAVHAEKAGAQAVLVVTPYYNKPNQEGLFQHFRAIDAAIGIPVIIYNIPPRSVIDMSVDTMKRCFGELRNIVGVKDATGNVARISLQRHAMGPDFLQFSGDDITALSCIAAGAHGCISVVSNAAPRPCAELMEAAAAGEYAKALAIQDRLVPLHAATFLEAGVTGAKTGLICSAAPARRFACRWCLRPPRPARRSRRRWSLPACCKADWPRAKGSGREMYEPAAFRVTEKSELVAFLRAFPLGLMIATTSSEPGADLVPMLIDDDGLVLRAHVARANPLAAALATPQQVLVVFTARRLCQPRPYPSKREHGRVVPTWNYAMVQARGMARLRDDGDWLARQLHDLTTQQEAGRETPWAVNDAPEDFLAAQRRAIIGVEVAIDDLRGKFKLSQNRTESDRQGVLAGLALEPSHAAQEMARFMSARKVFGKIG